MEVLLTSTDFSVYQLYHTEFVFSGNLWTSLSCTPIWECICSWSLFQSWIHLCLFLSSYYFLLKHLIQRTTQWTSSKRCLALLVEPKDNNRNWILNDLYPLNISENGWFIVMQLYWALSTLWNSTVSKVTGYGLGCQEFEFQ